MILITGGFAQGKKEYAAGRYPEAVFWDHGLPPLENIRKAECGRIHVINGFNDWCRKKLSQGEDVRGEVDNFLSHFPETVIISDSVGCGVVPVDKEERSFREWIGRLQCDLAAESEEVIRVVCGIGQKIK